MTESDPSTTRPGPRRRTLYEGRVLRLSLEDEKWEIVEHAPAVAVLAVREGRMLLVRQERRAIGASTLEAPAGLIDEGESPAEAAARELAEECQLAGDLTLLSSFYSSPGFTDERLHLFRAINLRPAEGDPDEDEALEIVWLEPQRLLEGLRDGSLHSSGPTVAAALFAMLEGKR